ncbi:ParA family protein [Deinococcus pimensis]|uniref:ParA family protein n=1 Tax=Deinococcus pimensis TaxID=309888 RepID=UPI000488E377|nr:ParA family protein [Deinococcus pimensis]
MRVLTFFNHAGGASKSSSARDVGYTLATMGFRVLLIDTDPQANLSAWLGVQGAPFARTVHLTATANRPLPEPFEVAGGMHLIPSTLQLAMVDAQLPGVVGGVLRLRRHVRDLKGRYDFVLIDSPPSLGQLSALAAIAADDLIVPVPTVEKGLQGLPNVLEMVENYGEVAPDLRVAFFLPTQYNAQTSHHKEALAYLRANVSPVGTPISYRPAIYPDAAAARQPVPLYAPGSAAAADIRRATEEILAALGVSAPNDNAEGERAEA